MPATTIATDIERKARLFHALSDRTRLGIIERLSRGERCVCELTDALDAAQSRLSFHLKVLRDAGLVSDRREGRWSYYRLNAEAFAEAESVAGAYAEAAASAPGSGCAC
ncbi:MAG TPA: metalloregulator ArsR/SmtB family transcription factor [Gemmatimonadales bacterium]|nr:metalloregulator ArsR/SmtB family transcription factor [Gemmatimonadales bacterium]